MFKKSVKQFAVALIAGVLSVAATAQAKYDIGANDKEIRIGNIAPYSGNASSYTSNQKTTAAYFEKLNSEGGINGRKIVYISRDDSYSPAKTLEMARKLNEQDEVLLIAATIGAAPSAAILPYVTERHVPMLFTGSGARKFVDHKSYPWTTGGFVPQLDTEAEIYATNLLETKPDAKVAVLYQNDDFGKDYVKGLEAKLGDKAKTMIVAKASYESTDPTVDSQIISLKASGADVLFNFSGAKFAAQAIKKMAEIGWKPTHYMTNASASVGSVLTPAGLQNSVGIITTQYLKEPTDPQWKNDPERLEWEAFMKKWNPNIRLDDYHAVYGYVVGKSIEHLLKQAGNDLTRENIMKQALNLDFRPPMLLPGIRVKTGPDDSAPVQQAQLSRFDGTSWVLFGKIYGK